MGETPKSRRLRGRIVRRQRRIEIVETAEELQAMIVANDA